MRAALARLLESRIHHQLMRKQRRTAFELLLDDSTKSHFQPARNSLHKIPQNFYYFPFFEKQNVLVIFLGVLCSEAHDSSLDGFVKLFLQKDTFELDQSLHPGAHDVDGSDETIIKT